MEAENERMRDALREVLDWSKAYPIRAFPEPDIEAINAALEVAGLKGQIGALHGTWARHIVMGIAEICERGLSDAT